MTQEALKLALETAEGIVNSDWRKWEEFASPEEFERWVKSRSLHMATAIKEALAQPEQEPVGEVLNERGEVDWISFVPPVGTKLYTTPPQRTWVGLTDEEMTHANHHMVEGAYQYSFKQGAKWAEAKLKQKNSFAEENT